MVKVKLVNTKKELYNEGIEEFKEFKFFEFLKLGLEVASFGDAGDLFAKRRNNKIVLTLTPENKRYCYDYDSNTSIEKYIEKFINDYNSDNESDWVLDTYYLKIEIENKKCRFSFVEVIDEELYSYLKEGFPHR